MKSVIGLDAEQARKVFPENQIQLIGIEARVFDDLADLETERQCRVVRSQEKELRPCYRTQSPTASLGSLHQALKIFSLSRSSSFR